MQAPKARVSFQSLDVNHDGYVARDKANADPTVQSHFTQIDKDGNGFVTEAEFSAFDSSQPADSGQ